MKKLKFKNPKLDVVIFLKSTILLIIVGSSFCFSMDKDTLVLGAEQTSSYLKYLKGKRVAVVANQTSVLRKKSGGYTHLVDTLIHLNINVVKVFAPEHGFRGAEDAGKELLDTKDEKTGIPIVSLYGKNKKPTPEHMKDVDIVVYDIQDVGVRFYSYISTLHLVMEACAEKTITLVVLDRPNPNGDYIDGPVLSPKFKSFVGMHPVPIVYGMTVGEYAKMINGEGWLSYNLTTVLIVVPMLNYTHETEYELPIKPSPNLPNHQAIRLYPSLCLFEGTNVSIGRGTEFPFQVYGSPYLSISYPYIFIPQPSASNSAPLHSGQYCYGRSLIVEKSDDEINLKWLIDAYNNTANKETFFNAYFDKLAGTDKLRKQIEEGVSEDDITDSWEDDIEEFEDTRKKYLLYSDDDDDD